MLAERYTAQAPDPQVTLDLFRGEWSSRIPLAFASTGHAALFNDERITWLINQDQSYRDKTALELGPLEAGHTYMLERTGYQIEAVEANSHAFLKCLIVKELLGLRSQFLFGDLNEHLKTSDSVGLCVASGVLYHQLDPIRTLQLIAAKAERLFLWTHYYDSDLCTGALFSHPEIPKAAPFPHTLYPRSYNQALEWDGFCGGPAPMANWLSRADLLRAVEHCGFPIKAAAFDHPTHQNGPCLAPYAIRQNRTPTPARAD